MAWDDNAKKLAIKVIGTVESNMKYDAINYNDPITVGIMQWYGTRAANLLNQIRGTSAWVGVAPSLTADLDAHPSSSASFWTSRWLARAEGASLKGVLTSTTGVQIQNAQTLTDLEEYATQARRVYIDPETNTQAFIYWATMYHQSPLYARRIANNMSGITLDRLYAATLNHSWYGKFRSRWNTAKAIILSGDSSGVPEVGVSPDPDEEGSVPTPGVGDDDVADGLTQPKSNISHIMRVGENLHIITNTGVTFVALPNGPVSWTISNSVAGTTPIPPAPELPPAPDLPVDASVAEKLVQFLVARIEKYRYSQGAGRNKPDQSLVTDCSALLQYAYKAVNNQEIGYNTVNQQKYGKVVWSNLPGNSYGAGPGDIPPAELLQKGDCCYFANDRSFQRVRHVEMFMGADHGNKLIGWGGATTAANPSGKGPYIKSSYSGYMNYWRWHVVRRML